MSKKLNIGGRSIGIQYPPYVIAELSANHNGDLATAFRLIEEAKRAGADAVKLQTYRADTITIDCEQPDFKITKGPWAGRTLYELYDWAHTPWSWHKALFAHARANGVTIFSSPFDDTAVDFLEDLNAPAYKIASFEAVDLPLIKYAASTGKPLIISTGIATAVEIEEAIDAAHEGGCTELAILHCVSAYPAPSEDYNLRTLTDMQARFGLPTGLSDHTLDNITAISSVALGACIIEKHFTLSRSGGGPDDSFSLEPEGLRELCRGAQTAWKALGEVNYNQKPSEQDSMQFRRSLYFVKNVQRGDTITSEHVKSIRPGFGMEPKLLPNVIGKTAALNIPRGTPVKANLLKQN